MLLKHMPPGIGGRDSRGDMEGGGRWRRGPAVLCGLKCGDGCRCGAGLERKKERMD